MKSTLILGIGNTLLGDEGAGVHALERVRTLLGDATDVELIDAGTLCFTLLPTLEAYRRLVVLDAAQLGAPAGTVAAFEGPAMDEFLGRPRRSVHEVGLCDLMDMARLSGCFPRQRVLIGIQPEFVDWSETCSPPVAAALDEAAQRAVDCVRRWDAEPTARAAA
ncbi:MAG TPA: HyaD/HybD family hydrogenase maturation endopeptidase [Steroidobacteraceae bacterium]|nr:HyaD/HybD family hydrogenase maturation endopeptidase [Steroidobacteraceae bacterium]